jgi:hypothetical protein
MRRMQVQKERRRTDSRAASPVTPPPPMDCRDLDVVRAKELQRERKC